MRALASIVRGRGNRLFVFKCAVLLAAIRLLLALFGARRLRARLPLGGGRVASAGALRRVGWGVQTAARLIPGTTCLPQAFAAQILLARKGYQARVRIGVARDERSAVIAHAWVLSGETIVVGGPAEEVQRYTPLLDFLPDAP